MLIILASVFFFIYLFNIYEVIYTVEPSSLNADNISIITISSKPINAFSKKIPFRIVPVESNIKEGNDLIDVLSKNESKGSIKLKAKNRAGTVIIHIKSRYDLFPSLMEIHIYPISSLKTPDI